MLVLMSHIQSVLFYNRFFSCFSRNNNKFRNHSSLEPKNKPAWQNLGLLLIEFSFKNQALRVTQSIVALKTDVGSVGESIRESQRDCDFFHL